MRGASPQSESAPSEHGVGGAHGLGPGKARLLSAGSGIDHHLTKPIDPDQLERVLAKVVKE